MINIIIYDLKWIKILCYKCNNVIFIIELIINGFIGGIWNLI